MEVASPPVGSLVPRPRGLGTRLWLLKTLLHVLSWRESVFAWRLQVLTVGSLIPRPRGLGTRLGLLKTLLHVLSWRESVFAWRLQVCTVGSLVPRPRPGNEATM